VNTACVAVLVGLVLGSPGAGATHPDRGDSSDSPFKIRHRDVPPDYRQAFEFLEFIKVPEEPRRAFRSEDAPRWNVGKLLSFIRSSGLLITDVNEPGVDKVYSVDELRRSLIARAGKAFRTMAHLSHIYSIPYTQYSELKFEPVPDGVAVRLSSWYRLTFVRELGAWKLAKCEYTEIEGD
jgi:hypothetical protein